MKIIYWRLYMKANHILTKLLCSLI